VHLDDNPNLRGYNCAPQNFFESWLDYWIICDDSHAYLFFPDDHGRMYRSRTTLAEIMIEGSRHET